MTYIDRRHKCGDRVKWEGVKGVPDGEGMCIAEDYQVCLIRSDRVKAIHENSVEHYMLRLWPIQLQRA